MKVFSHTISFAQIRILFFLISKINCFEDFIEESLGMEKEREDEHEDERPDMMKVLEDLRVEIQNISKDIAKYDTLIYLLIPAASLLFLILVSFSIYELIKCCKKREKDLIEATKPNKYLYSENINNSSKSKISSTDSSSQKQIHNKEEVKNSFLSSKDSSNLASKDVFKSDVTNSLKEKKNLNESNNINNGEVGGYVAPPIDMVNNNNEDKYFTNNGEEEPEKKKTEFKTNPFLNE